uniref:Uncharacterized protein n=1 Tax=Rhizophora mucronata TaxID=61149 RepID=A0A2P2Q6E3_RHIMU
MKMVPLSVSMSCPSAICLILW